MSKVRTFEYYFDAPFTKDRVRIYCYNGVCYICNKELRIMTGKSKNGLAPRLIDKETNTTFNKMVTDILVNGDTRWPDKIKQVICLDDVVRICATFSEWKEEHVINAKKQIEEFYANPNRFAESFVIQRTPVHMPMQAARCIPVEEVKQAKKRLERDEVEEEEEDDDDCVNVDAKEVFPLLKKRVARRSLSQRKYAVAVRDDKDARDASPLDLLDLLEYRVASNIAEIKQLIMGEQQQRQLVALDKDAIIAKYRESDAFKTERETFVSDAIAAYRESNEFKEAVATASDIKSKKIFDEVSAIFYSI